MNSYSHYEVTFLLEAGGASGRRHVIMKSQAYQPQHCMKNFYFYFMSAVLKKHVKETLHSSLFRIPPFSFGVRRIQAVCEC